MNRKTGITLALLFAVVILAALVVGLAQAAPDANLCYVLSWQYNRLIIFWPGAPTGANTYWASFLLWDNTGRINLQRTTVWSTWNNGVLLQLPEDFSGYRWGMSQLSCTADYGWTQIETDTNPADWVGEFRQFFVGSIYIQVQK